LAVLDDLYPITYWLRIADAIDRVIESTSCTSVGKYAVPPVFWLSSSNARIVDVVRELVDIELQGLGDADVVEVEVDVVREVVNRRNNGAVVVR